MTLTGAERSERARLAVHSAHANRGADTASKHQREAELARARLLTLKAARLQKEAALAADQAARYAEQVGA